MQALANANPELARRFGVTRLALFGSTARDEARSDSDVDIVVSFDGPATSQRYFGVQFCLENLLGCTVDLVTDKAPHMAVAVSEGSHHVKHAVTDSELFDNRPSIGTAILAI